MNEILNRRRMAIMQNAQPYDAEVEYLESSGTQYINTGILCQSGLSYEMVVTPLSGGNAFLVYFGASKNRKYAFMVVLNNNTKKFYSQCGSSSSTYNSTVITFGSQCSIKGSTNGTTVLTVNNTSSTSAGGTSHPDANLHIFANYNGGDAAMFRLHSLKMMLNNVYVRDFIPVRVGQVGYMYDRVSGEMYGNAGTGSFVLGNDKKGYPYIEDGLVLWLDGINKGGVAGHWIDLIGGVDFVADNGVVAESDGFLVSRANDYCFRNATYSNAGSTASTYTIEACFINETENSAFQALLPISGIALGYSTYIIIGAQDDNGGQWTRYTTAFPRVNCISANYDNAIENGSALSKNATGYYNKQSSTRAGRLNGKIYSLRVYNRKLTKAEMLANQKVDNERFNLGLTLPDSI